MQSVDDLIKETYESAQSNFAILNSMTDMYLDDMKDFMHVKDMIVNKTLGAARTFINEMDTLPREKIVVAIAQDMGNDFCSNELQFEVYV